MYGTTIGIFRADEWAEIKPELSWRMWWRLLVVSCYLLEAATAFLQLFPGNRGSNIAYIEAKLF